MKLSYRLSFKKLIVSAFSCLAIGLLLVPAQGKAQWGGYHAFATDWEITLHLGMTSFYGDVTDNKNRIYNNSPFHRYFYEDRGFAYGVMLRKNMSPYYSFRGVFLRGDIYGSSDRYGLYFNAVTNHYYLGANLDLTSLMLGVDDNRPWELYAFAGLGFNDSRTWLYDASTDNLVGTNGFGSERWLGGDEAMARAATIPFGIGFSYELHNNWSFNMETSIHGVNTDRLDAFESDDTKTEGFGYSSIGLTYHFNFPYQLNLRRYPKTPRRSNDPAIREYNKRRQVVMDTKASRRAARNRYVRPDRKNFFQRLGDRIRLLRYRW